MNKNDIDIDTQIINYIAERAYAQPKEVIAKFAREGQKKRKSKGDNETTEDTNTEISEIMKEDPKESKSKEVDFKANEEDKKSKRTIQRRLKKLEREGGPIIEATEEQLIRYGIMTKDGRKTDCRAKYLTLRETIERDKDLDEIINHGSKGDNIKQKMVLREINRSKGYILLPSQLAALVLKLDNEDAEITEGFLSILHQYITKKKIKPNNEEILVEKLKKVLKRYPEGHEKHALIRTYAINLLGHYEDKAVINQLTKDCSEGRLSKFKDDYCGWTTAKAIKKARKKLFDLENKLRKEGDTVSADALAEVRDKAEEVLETQKETDEREYKNWLDLL